MATLKSALKNMILKEIGNTINPKINETVYLEFKEEYLSLEDKYELDYSYGESEMFEYNTNFLIEFMDLDKIQDLIFDYLGDKVFKRLEKE